MKMLLTAVVATLTAPAGAETQAEVERRYSAEYNRCLASGDAARGVTVAMMDCNGAEIELQDAQLNQAYRMVMQRLSPPGKAQLRVSERAWIVQRDRRCRRSARTDQGGTIAGLTYGGCILDATMRRTMWLEHYPG